MSVGSRERGAQRVAHAGRGRVERQPLDQPPDRRGAEEAAAREPEHERRGQQRERGQERELRRLAAGDEGERRRARRWRRRAAAPGRARGARRGSRPAAAAPAARSSRRSPPARRPVSSTAKTSTTPGASRDAVLVAQQHLREVQDGGHEVAGGDGDARRPPLQPPGGEREQEVDQQRDDQRVDERAEQERQRGVGELQARRHGREPDREHQRAGAVVRAAQPREHARGHEAPRPRDADVRDREPAVGERVGVGGEREHDDTEDDGEDAHRLRPPRDADSASSPRFPPSFMGSVGWWPTTSSRAGC